MYRQVYIHVDFLLCVCVCDLCLFLHICAVLQGYYLKICMYTTVCIHDLVALVEVTTYIYMIV